MKDGTSVATKLHDGETVSRPRGATFVQVVDADGKTAVVSLKDIGALKGAGPFTSALFGIKGTSGKTKGVFIPLKGQVLTKAALTLLPSEKYGHTGNPTVPVQPLDKPKSTRKIATTAKSGKVKGAILTAIGKGLAVPAIVEVLVHQFPDKSAKWLNTITIKISQAAPKPA